MRVKSFFFLVLFATFLVTPIIVSLIQDNEKTLVISMTEEEKSTNNAYEFEKDVKISIGSFAFNLLRFEDNEVSNYEYNNKAHIVYIDLLYPPPKFI